MLSWFSALKRIETLLGSKSNNFRFSIVLTHDLLEDRRTDDVIHIKILELERQTHSAITSCATVLLLP